MENFKNSIFSGICLLFAFAFLLAGCTPKAKTAIQSSSASESRMVSTEPDSTPASTVSTASGQFSSNSSVSFPAAPRQTVSSRSSIRVSPNSAPQSKPSQQKVIPSTPKRTVSLPAVSSSKPSGPQVAISIDCSTAAKWYQKKNQKPDPKIIPANGVILPQTMVSLQAGDTVFSVLRRVVQDRKITLSTTGFGGSAYIKGINGLNQFSCGSLSGWDYYVNGAYQNRSSGSYTLKSGEKIEWKYTCDMGRDLNNH